jgi:cystathionine gamma-synthase
MAPAFRHIPLGERIPDRAHAVSCSLPTMRDVCGYEERDPEVLRRVTSGYPRFVVHPFARELGAHLAAVDPAVGERALWLTSSGVMAARLIEHLGPEADAARHDGHGVAGVSHTSSADLSGRAKTFLQHVGGFISTRQAEDHLVRLGLRTEAAAEAVSDGNGTAEVARHLAGVLPGTTGADLFIANNGMNAIHAAFRAVSDIQVPRGRTIWLQLGWLYLDTIAILQKFTAASGDYVYVRDVFDTGGLERLVEQHGPRLAGVVAEVPTNPLVQTPDLPALAALCRRHGARLLVDPSMSSVYNVDVLPHADVVVSSLTKYTGHEGDLTAGLAAVNPQGPDAAALREELAGWIEPLYARDAARLAREIADMPGVLARIRASTPRVVAFLEQHPAVRDVFWALHPASRTHYVRIARAPDAVSGVVTFTLREPGSLARVYDRLRLPKGPSFGMQTTLLCPFMYLAHYDLVTTAAGRARLAADGLDPDLLRLSVGTEPVDEIIAALDDALS